MQKQKQKAMIHMRAPQEIGVFDRDTRAFRDLAKKTNSAATHSGLVED